MNQIQSVIDLAFSQVGYTEEPKNSNLTKYGKLYGWNGVPWCVQFLWWLYFKLGLSYLFYGGKKTASCTELKSYYESNNQWIYNNDYKVGDLAIMTFSKNRQIQHCGIIVERINYSQYKTIEGNTSSSKTGSQDNGGMVALKTRTINNILGVCRPHYIIEEDEDMTDEKFEELMNKYLANQAKKELPTWAQKEMNEAIKLGITDGTRPMQLIPRYQAAIMALRAAKAAK